VIACTGAGSGTALNAAAAAVDQQTSPPWRSASWAPDRLLSLWGLYGGHFAEDPPCDRQPAVDPVRRTAPARRDRRLSCR